MTRRLLISFLSITAFVLLVLEVPLGFSYATAERRRLETDVQHDAFALAIRSEEAFESTLVPTLNTELQSLAREYRHQTGGRAVFVDQTGMLVADSQDADLVKALAEQGPTSFTNRPEIRTALRGHEASGTRTSHTLGGELVYVAVPVGSTGRVLGAVRVTYPMSYVDGRVRDNWLLLAGVAGVVLVAAFGVCLVLARSLTKPLAVLEQGATDLGDGNLASRVPVPRGPHELRNLARSFNATAAQLESLLGAQQAFMADASHQLRAPLAALRLRLENLESEVASGGREELEDALTEVTRVSRLVDGLLALARAEQSGPHRGVVDVRTVVEGRRDAWAALAEERNVRLVVQGSDNVRVLATPGNLEQVLDNLLNNALDVAPPNSAVRMSVRRAADRVVISVADEGPGLNAADKERAFDRFWRSNEAEEGGGLGLGLAIVRRLVTADGGGVELTDAPRGGLEVVVRLQDAP